MTLGGDIAGADSYRKQSIPTQACEVLREPINESLTRNEPLNLYYHL